MQYRIITIGHNFRFEITQEEDYTLFIGPGELNGEDICRLERIEHF